MGCYWKIIDFRMVTLPLLHLNSPIVFLYQLFIHYVSTSSLFNPATEAAYWGEGHAERIDLKEDEGEVWVRRLQRLLEDLSQRTSSQIPFHLGVLGFHRLSVLQNTRYSTWSGCTCRRWEFILPAILSLNVSDVHCFCILLPSRSLCPPTNP